MVLTLSGCGLGALADLLRGYEAAGYSAADIPVWWEGFDHSQPPSPGAFTQTTQPPGPGAPGKTTAPPDAGAPGQATTPPHPDVPGQATTPPHPDAPGQTATPPRYPGASGQTTPAPDQGAPDQTILPPGQVHVAYPVSLNTELLSMIGRTNAELRAVNGDNGLWGVWHGMAFVSYFDYTVHHPVGFFLTVEWADIYSALYEPGENNPYRNIWPDESRIFEIFIWGDAIKHVFHANGPVTFGALSAIMPVHSDLNHLREQDQEHDPYGYDVWYCIFFYECYEMYATFREEESDLVLIEMYINDGST